MGRRRSEDWPVKFAEYLKDRGSQPFEWGKNDCALFAADWVILATGIDPAAWYRGRYDSELGAARALIEAGVGSLADAVTEVLGPPLSNPYTGQRGDIAMMPNDGNPSLGIVTGAAVSLIRINGGLSHQPLRSALFVWKV